MAENARATEFSFYARLNTPSSASTVHTIRAFRAAASTLRYYLLYFARVQFITSFNQSTAFIIPVLTTFLQLKFQGNDQNNTPFATHPTTMLVAVSSSVIYYLAFVALRQSPFRRFAVVGYHCMVWSSYASVASLASVLFPDSVSPCVYAIFALLPLFEFLQWLCRKLVMQEDAGGEFQVHRTCVRRFLNNIYRVVANSSRQRQRLLPI